LVEVAGVAPTVGVEDQSSVEVIEDKTLVEKKIGDLAVHEDVGTGDEPVLESVEERTGAEPVFETVEIRTKEEPFLQMWRWKQVICLFMRWRWVILTLRITRVMILRR